MFRGIIGWQSGASQTHFCPGTFLISLRAEHEVSRRADVCAHGDDALVWRPAEKRDQGARVQPDWRHGRVDGNTELRGHFPQGHVDGFLVKGANLLRLLVIIFLPIEKTRSIGAEVSGIPKILLAIRLRSGN